MLTLVYDLSGKNKILRNRKNKKFFSPNTKASGKY